MSIDANEESSGEDQKPARDKPKHTSEPVHQGVLADNVKTIGYALLIALFIRIFLFQPFNIPSASMKPNLLVGDYLFVSKYAYGFSRHSFPFSPAIFGGRIFASQPERGDVIVFKFPPDGRTDYIKRLIGMPGDTVQMVDGVLHINGRLIRRERVDDFIDIDKYGRLTTIPQFREYLPNGVSYTTLDSRNSSTDNTSVFSVPQGHYFMMGDNRDNSSDSRLTVGYVPFENLVGQAEVLFYSTDGSAKVWQFWNWFSAMRWQRFFTSVQ